MARRVTAVLPSPNPDSAQEPLAESLTRVFRYWKTAGLHTEQTLSRMTETVTRFADRLTATGVLSFVAVTPVDAAQFVTARTRTNGEPELATRHARRTAIRTLYRSLRALGTSVGDPTLDLVLPPRGLLAARPLNDDEVALCRASAQLGLPRAVQLRSVVWALGEATAVTSEITAVTIASLDDPAAPTTVRLPGTRRHDQRWAVLTEWGRRVITRHVATLLELGATSGTALAYTGAAAPGGAKAQAAACNAIRHVLDAAGCAGEADVRPASLRNWCGRRLYDGGASIEQVARALGHRSLDACAEDIALTWRKANR